MKENFEGADANPQREDPNMVIEAIRQNMMKVGGVDFESGRLDEIKLQLKRGEITAEKAIKKARRLDEERQERYSTS